MTLIQKKIRMALGTGYPAYLTADQVKKIRTNYPALILEETTPAATLPAKQKAYFIREK